jgi:acylphosphatase
MVSDESAPALQRLTATVSGRVQAVGYRDFCRRTAQGLSRELGEPLTGYARNQADGSVEVVAEGSRAILELLLERLTDGPGFAQVRSVKPSWTAPSREFDSFTIRF